MQIGRIEIFTDYPEITADNVIKVIQNSITKHSTNRAMIDTLLNYEAGYQPLKRKKNYRPDIDCKCVDNVANEIIEFKLGYQWGNPITLVQRGENDNGLPDEEKAVTILNECYNACDNAAKTQKLARFVEICGIGYTFADINADYEDGESYFTLEALDPRNTFLVKSNYYIDHRPMLGVTYRTDEKDNRYYTAWSKDTRYEIAEELVITNGKKMSEWSHEPRSGEMNPLGTIPIVEWLRSYDRMGAFERHMSELDNLNLLVSDFTNDVEQNTQCVWHGNDIEFPKDKDGREIRPTSNDWMLTQTTQDGREPFIKPLSIEYNYDGMLANILNRRQLILQKCSVPERNSDSGGSTGVAMSDATGWSAAETAAAKQECIMSASKMAEVKVVLQAIKNSPYVPSDSPILELRYNDVIPNIKRQKTYELTVKSNAFATLVSHGLYGLHALKITNMCDDVNQVWADSKELIEEYQTSIFEGKNDSVGGEGESSADASNTMSDYSDQEHQSNIIGEGIG